MSLSILVVMDTLAEIKVHKDTTVAMMLSAARRGHRLFYCQAKDVYVQHGEARAHVARVWQVYDREHDWIECEAFLDDSLNSFDVILLRKDPPVDLDYLYLTHALQLAENAGVLVANRPQAVRDANEKAFTMHFSKWTPPTVISRKKTILLEFMRVHQDVVLKPLDAMGGQSVFRVSASEVNVNALLDVLTHHEQERIIAQRFIPEIAEGDKRIILVNGEPMAYALNRIPSEKDWRGNLAVGARGVAVTLTEREQRLSGELSSELQRRGLYFVGLDVIGGYLTEINVTSPTGVREIQQQTGLDIADCFIDFLEQKRRG